MQIVYKRDRVHVISIYYYLPFCSILPDPFIHFIPFSHQFAFICCLLADLQFCSRIDENSLTSNFILNMPFNTVTPQCYSSVMPLFVASHSSVSRDLVYSYRCIKYQVKLYFMIFIFYSCSRSVHTPLVFKEQRMETIDIMSIDRYTYLSFILNLSLLNPVSYSDTDSYCC